MSVGTMHLKEHSCFEWVIPSYLSLSQKTDASCRSPSFEYLREFWYLQIYPNGRRNDSSAGWISLYLCRESYNLQRGLVIEYTIGLKRDEIITTDYRNSFTFTMLSNKDGYHQFLKRSDLLPHSIPYGYLTVYCLLDPPRKRLRRDSFCQTESPENTSWYKMKRHMHSLLCNMKELLLSGKNYDITLEVKGKEFHVHKNILGARSPIFSAMFEHNMKENLSGVVSITDAEPDVFRDILLYMYCGEVERMCSENASEYYKIADKYSLQELKDESLKLMERSLLITNACDIFLLGDVYNEANLKELAKDFIIKNIISILATDSWKSFSRENQTLSIQILEMAITEGPSMKS